MAMERLRSRWETASAGMVRALGDTDPSTLTWISLPFGLVAAVLLASAPLGPTGGWMLLGAFVCISVATLLDGLDGSLARATNRATRWGDYLDHTLDRVLDILWIVAIASNAAWFGTPVIGWIAAMTTMFGSYLGTQAQAVAGTRNYGGFSRADRLILTILGILVASTLAFLSIDPMPLGEQGFQLSPLSIVVLCCGLGGIWTFLVRFLRARADLKMLDAKEPLCPTDGDDGV